jgi:hypothetical protein
MHRKESRVVQTLLSESALLLTSSDQLSQRTSRFHGSHSLVDLILAICNGQSSYTNFLRMHRKHRGPVPEAFFVLALRSDSIALARQQKDTHTPVNLL